MSTLGLSILVGVLAGFAGAIPLMVALRMTRTHPTASTVGSAAQGLMGVFVSLVVLVIELIVCSKVAHGSLVPFGVAEIVSLIVVTTVYVTLRMRPKRDR